MLTWLEANARSKPQRGTAPPIFADVGKIPRDLVSDLWCSITERISRGPAIRDLIGHADLRRDLADDSGSIATVDASHAGLQEGRMTGISMAGEVKRKRDLRAS